MISVIRWSLWQHRWSMVWWSLGSSAFIGLNLAFYPSFKEQAEELDRVLRQLPEGLIDLFAGSNDFVSPIGFLNSQVFYLMLPLLLGTLAIMLGSGLIAKEEREKTLHLLLARPVSRMQVTVAKVVTGLLVLSVVTVVTAVVTLVLNELTGLSVDVGRILAGFAGLYLFVVASGAVAFALTMVGLERGASGGLAAVVALGGYLTTSLSGQVEQLEPVSKALPYYYYQSEPLLRGTYDWWQAWYFVALLLVCAVVSWYFFARRDLAS